MTKEMSKARYNQQLLIRLTPEEKALAIRRASETGLTVSEYIRRCALKQRLPQRITDISVQTYQELGKISVYLQQLAVSCNSSVTPGVATIDAEVLTRLEQLLHQIRLEIATGKLRKIKETDDSKTSKRD